jgi:uncharacterized protein
MAFSLHAATVPSYLQILGAVADLIDKAEAFCMERGIAPVDVIGARLAPDMRPFAYQVKSVVVHSRGAIDSVRNGAFAPDHTPPPQDFATLRGRIIEARSALFAIDPAEMDTFLGRRLRFVDDDQPMDFLAEDFLLSFAQPNFYFHATTTYAILRWLGVPLGKFDFLGPLRTRP